MQGLIRRALALELICLTWALPAARAQTDLTSMKIEDLMNLDVTSASKKEQKLSRVPAAIFVISRSDIEHSGATNIADLLRMVPGLEVAQINANTWAISARGFNDQYSNKLLVLVDGLQEYVPVFSGVYWDSLDFTVDTIERIEVIRGPGAAIWGANAVNGVINIISKKSQDTQGLVLSAHGGTVEHGSGSVRYGGHLGGKGAYRVFADGFQIGHFPSLQKENAKDDWFGAHGGFRLDTPLSPQDSLTVQGTAFKASEGERTTTILSWDPPVDGTVAVRSHYSGWNVLGRWQHTGSPGSETSLQFYFDRTNRGDTTYPLGLNAYDVDFQNHQQLGHRNDFVWGLGYRLSSDITEQTLRISFTPKGLNTHTFSSFVQYEIAVIPNHVYATVGAKLQHEYYNGFNLQPTARLTWLPGKRQMFWAALSGAQRTPSRAETTVEYNYFAYAGADNLIVLTAVFGNPHQRNERLVATEAGFRTGISDRLSFDVATFFNRYTHLASVEPQVPRFTADPPPLHLLVPFLFGNLVHGETHGAEVSANLKLANRWTLTPQYSFLSMHIHTDPLSLDETTVVSTQGARPDHQAQLRSSIRLPWRLQSTTSAFFVDRLQAQSIPSYTRLDSTLTWEGSDKLSVGIAGQNLIKNLHQEFGGPVLSVEPSLIPRSAYAWLTRRF